LEFLQDWLLRIVGKFGYLGVLLLIALENLFPPIPSEVILTFGGFLTTKTALTAVGTVLAATAGSVVGAVALYFIGALLGMDRLERFVERYGKYLRIRVSDVHRATGWFERYKNKTVFFCRMVPIVRSLISIPAGVARMRMPSFLLLTTLGSLIWNTVLVAAGAILGENWESVLTFFDVYSTFCYIVLVLGIVLVLVGLFWRRGQKL